MKEIKAIVRPIMADRVIDSLRELSPLPGMIVSTVTGYGSQALHAGPPLQVEDAPMTKIEIVVADAAAESVIDAIVRAARTGRGGDGKIVVYAVADVVKIADGKRGETAL